MRPNHIILLLAIAATLGFCTHAAVAQQATVGTPFNSVGDSFYERIGGGFSGRIGGVPFSVNGGGVPNPQFGGAQPGAGLTGGFGFNGGGFNGMGSFGMSQGSRRTMTSQTPSVTMMNGQGASISDTSLTPFVIGYQPVVGGFPIVGYVNPIRPMPAYGNSMTPMRTTMPMGNHRVQQFRQQAGNQAQRAPKAPPEPMAAVPLARPPQAIAPQAPAGPSSATRAAPSVAEAKRLREQEQSIGDKDALLWFEKGKTAEAEGKYKVAKIFYQMAARRAKGPLLSQIQARLNAVGNLVPQ